MKAKRVDCQNCANFGTTRKLKPLKITASCKLGKRVMFRMPKQYDAVVYLDSGGWFRYCNDFKQM
jgi:hypothetical protein